MKEVLAGLMLLACLSGIAQVYPAGSPACATHRAGSYLIELAGCNNYIDIFLYDLKKKPVRGTEITGKAEFNYIDETCASSEFIQYGKTNSLRAEIPAPGFYDFKITLFVKGDTICSYFDNSCDQRAQVSR